MIGRCARCDTFQAQVEDLQRRLDRAEEERGKLTDRLMALADPQALTLARAGRAGASGVAPSFGYDPEGGHTAMVGGEERRIAMVHGKQYVDLGGKLVPANEYSEWIDFLANGAEGEPPGRRDEALPPLPKEAPRGRENGVTNG